MQVRLQVEDQSRQECAYPMQRADDRRDPTAILAARSKKLEPGATTAVAGAGERVDLGQPG